LSEFLNQVVGYGLELAHLSEERVSAQLILRKQNVYVAMIYQAIMSIGIPVMEPQAEDVGNVEMRIGSSGQRRTDRKRMCSRPERIDIPS